MNNSIGLSFASSTIFFKGSHNAQLFTDGPSSSCEGFFYVGNLEKDISLKWALFDKVSGQTTSDVLWK